MKLPHLVKDHKEEYHGKPLGLFGKHKILPDGNHRAAMLKRSLELVNSNNPIGIAAIGMSNLKDQQEFIAQHMRERDINPRVRFAKSAKGGMDLPRILGHEGQEFYGRYWDRWVPNALDDAGIWWRDVQVVWVKGAIGQPQMIGDGSWPHHYDKCVDYYVELLALIQEKFPNVKMVLGQSRTSGAWSRFLNPEPYAFEAGLAWREVVLAQHERFAGNAHLANDEPWLGWGLYCHDNKAAASEDGNIFGEWTADDFRDGSHTDEAASRQVGRLADRWLRMAPWSKDWYLKN